MSLGWFFFAENWLVFAFLLYVFMCYVCSSIITISNLSSSFTTSCIHLFSAAVLEMEVIY